MDLILSILSNGAMSLVTALVLFVLLFKSVSCKSVPRRFLYSAVSLQMLAVMLWGHWGLPGALVLTLWAVCYLMVRFVFFRRVPSRNG